MTADPELIRYYSRRASEYDRVFAKPERQEDLGELRNLVADWCAGERVLEVACGTGYWTEVIAPVASSVVATDASEETLEIARTRDLGETPVETKLADAFRLDEIAGDFTCLFAGFWLSHVERERVAKFLDGVNARLGAGGHVVLMDNRYVEGSSTPIARRNAAGDTFQARRLESGETYEVLKNFFEAEELAMMVAPYASETEIRELRHYWAVRYRIDA